MGAVGVRMPRRSDARGGLRGVARMLLRDMTALRGTTHMPRDAEAAAEAVPSAPSVSSSRVLVGPASSENRKRKDFHGGPIGGRTHR